MSIRWNKMLEVGHKLVDAEHKELVKIAKTVQSSTKSEDFATVKEVFSNYNRHTEKHFTSEEKLLEEINSKGLELHKQQHSELLTAAYNLADKFEENKDITSFKKDFKKLYNAMIQHIINYDFPIFNSSD